MITIVVAGAVYASPVRCMRIAHHNFDANRLAYRFNNKDVTQTNNNNNRSTQSVFNIGACTYAASDSWCNTQHCHRQARIRLNDLQIQCSRARTLFIQRSRLSHRCNAATDNTHSISYIPIPGSVARRNIYYAILYGLVCVGLHRVS